MSKIIEENNRVIRVVQPSEKNDYITESDAEMDARAEEAVRAAISKAKFCKKPIAKFDPESRTSYIEYPDGSRVNVK